MTKKMTTAQKAERAASAKETLLEFITPQTRLYFIPTYINATGLVKHFVAIEAVAANHAHDLTPLIAACCGFPLTKYGSIKLTGCGYSGAAFIAAELTRELFGSNHPCLAHHTF